MKYAILLTTLLLTSPCVYSMNKSNADRSRAMLEAFIRNKNNKDAPFLCFSTNEYGAESMFHSAIRSFQKNVGTLLTPNKDGDAPLVIAQKVGNKRAENALAAAIFAEIKASEKKSK